MKCWNLGKLEELRNNNNNNLFRNSPLFFALFSHFCVEIRSTIFCLHRIFKIWNTAGRWRSLLLTGGSVMAPIALAPKNCQILIWIFLVGYFFLLLFLLLPFTSSRQSLRLPLLSKRQNGQQQENEAELLVIRRPGCGWMRTPAAELSEQPQKGNSGSIVCLFFSFFVWRSFCSGLASAKLRWVVDNSSLRATWTATNRQAKSLVIIKTFRRNASESRRLCVFD